MGLQQPGGSSEQALQSRKARLGRGLEFDTRSWSVASGLVKGRSKGRRGRGP